MALNPATPPEAIEYVLDRIDLVCVMTVNPGFGGQGFIGAMLPKIAQLSEMIGERPVHIEIDGGVTAENAGNCVAMGADALVPMLAAERRIGAAVLYSGGGGITRAPPTSVQAFNYLPRVTQPVLMLNGRWDIDSPPAAQQRMFELLGAPADRKKQLLFDTGHGNLPRFQVEKATLEWLDRYLGVATGATAR